MSEELPWRCVTCGAETEAVIKGTHGPAVDIVATQLDERYATRWCPWCKRPRESVRAATYRDATALRRERPATAPAPDQLKGGW